jgi:hypothetical protein
MDKEENSKPSVENNFEAKNDACNKKINAIKHTKDVQAVEDDDIKGEESPDSFKVKEATYECEECCVFFDDKFNLKDHKNRYHKELKKCSGRYSTVHQELSGRYCN